MNRFLRLSLITVAAVVTAWYFNTIVNATTPQNCHCSKSKLPPISASNLYQVHVLNWARDAAVLSFHYDYNNADQWLSNYSAHFTPLGWVLYYRALKVSGNLEKVKRDKITVNAMPLEPPVMISQSIEGSDYQWKVRVPLLIQYQSNAGTTQQKVMVTMTVKPTDPSKSREDFAIELFAAHPLVVAATNSVQ